MTSRQRTFGRSLALGVMHRRMALNWMLLGPLASPVTTIFNGKSGKAAQERPAARAVVKHPRRLAGDVWVGERDVDQLQGKVRALGVNPQPEALRPAEEIGGGAGRSGPDELAFGFRAHQPRPVQRHDR